MRRLFLICPCLFLVAGFSSCYQNLYFTDRANSPCFSGKGEFKFTGAVKPQVNDQIPDTTGARSIKFSPISPEADVAYAITKHIAVTASYSSVVNRYIEESRARGMNSEKRYDTTIGGNINLHSAEVGGGYFGKVGNVFRYGLYGNVGFGTIKRHGIVLPHHNFRSRFFKYSLQPEIGCRPGGGAHFAFSGGMRFTWVKYYGFRAGNPDTKYALGDYSVKKSNDNVLTQAYPYMEPYLNFEVGDKYLKLNFQFGASVGSGENANHIGNSPYLSMGVVFHFDPAY